MSDVMLAGVDGCRGGWLAAVLDAGEVSWRLVPTFRDLYDDDALAVIAIDVPIGLPESAGAPAMPRHARLWGVAARASSRRHFAPFSIA